MTRPILLAVSVVTLLSFSSRASQFAHLQPSIRDLVQTAWTQHEGIPLADVDVRAQTSDGYLWLSSSNEVLLRFDGVRFTSIPSPCGARIAAFVDDGSEGMWLECGSQLYHRDRSGLAVAIRPNPLPADIHPTGYFTDSRRRLWFWGHTLMCVQANGTGAVAIHGLERSGNEHQARIVEDRDGTIWFASHSGVFRIQGNVAERVFASGDTEALAPSQAGGVNILTPTAILRARNRTVSTLVKFPPGMVSGVGRILLETPAGVWFGTRNLGVALFRSGKIETFGRREGLSSDSVFSIKADREGDIWVGTALGLHRFREPLAYLMSEQNGLPPGMPWVVFRDRANGFWFGTDRGIKRVDQKSGATHSWTGHYPAIGEYQGRIWLASDDEIGYVEQDRLVYVPGDDGKPIGSVEAFRSDESGNLWALSASGLYRIEGRHPKLIETGKFGVRFLVSGKSGTWISMPGGGLLHIDHDRRTVFGPESGLAEGTVFAITEEDDSVWVGTREGLSRWRNGRWTTWTPAQGLPGRGVFEITTDAQHRLWMMSYDGILGLDQASLAETPDGRPDTLNYFKIGMLDRVMPHRGGIGTSPRVATGLDGKLYFDTMDSVAVVDPTLLRAASFAPRVLIEDFLVDRRSVLKDNSQPFVRPDDVQFDYTSLNLRAPENVRFRYKLENYDKDWVDAGGKRRASYGSLRPGSYSFRVVGYGAEGVWNKEGASLTFRIIAPFYERMPFLLGGLTAIVSLLWIAHRYRLRLESERVRLMVETQGNERFRIAQDLHDTLLQEIHGSQFLVVAAVESFDTQPAEARRLLEQALNLLGGSAEHARETVFSLRATPLDGEVLITKLRRIAEEESLLFSEASKVSVAFSGTARELLPEVEEHICQITSEACRNALRHAKASFVCIDVRFASDDFQVIVKDDGVGMSPNVQRHGKPNHFGMTGMRERAARISGHLRVKSTEGQGTEISLSLPSLNAYRSSPRAVDGS